MVVGDRQTVKLIKKLERLDYFVWLHHVTKIDHTPTITIGITARTRVY